MMGGVRWVSSTLPHYPDSALRHSREYDYHNCPVGEHAQGARRPWGSAFTGRSWRVIGLCAGSVWHRVSLILKRSRKRIDGACPERAR